MNTLQFQNHGSLPRRIKSRLCAAHVVPGSGVYQNGITSVYEQWNRHHSTSFNSCRLWSSCKHIQIYGYKHMNQRVFFPSFYSSPYLFIITILSYLEQCRPLSRDQLQSPSTSQLWGVQNQWPTVMPIGKWFSLEQEDSFDSEHQNQLENGQVEFRNWS